MSELPFDGSDLGSLPRSAIVKDVCIGGCRRCTLDLSSLGYGRTTCIVQCARTRYACVVDECRPLFGLPRVGTHTLRLGGSLKLLTPSKRKRTESDVRLTIAMREVLGSKTRTEVENELGLLHDETVTTPRQLAKHFHDVTIDDVLRQHFHGHADDEIARFRFAFERIVKRVDPSLVWTVACVVERLTVRLVT